LPWGPCWRLSFEYECAGIAPRRHAAKVCRPAQPHRAKLQRRHLLLLQHEPHVPVERHARVLAHPCQQAAHAGRTGQQPSVVGQAERAEDQAEPVLAIPHLPAQHGGGAQPVAEVLPADPRPAFLRNRHPVARELLDPHRQPVVGAQDGGQAGSGAPAVRQQSGEVQLGEIADLVALPQRRGADAEQAAQVIAEAVAAGSVQADRRLGAGTRAVEQRQRAVVEDVEEGDQRAVAMVAGALARVLREVQRQRAVRPQQAGEMDRQPRPALRRGRREAAQRARLETQRGILAEAHGFVARPQRRANAGLAGIRVLQQPQRLHEIHADGAFGQPALHVYRVAHAPSRAGQRMMVPRATVRTTVSVNVLMLAYWAKK
jgi:hypothetical protein